MIREAVEFAVEAHKGAVRKGTQTPYIVHPLEAAVIVGSMTEDQELVAAAILHDVLEDTDAREEDLRQRFGDRVADLVVEETDDKTLSWLERKKGKLERVARGSRDLKMVVLGDKLSNMRCTARHHMITGHALWQRLNQKRKHPQGSYYWGIAHALRDLQDHIYYREYIMLCTAVFGKPED